MVLQQEQLDSFMDQALNKLQLRILRANSNGNLDEVAMELGLSELLGDMIPYCDFYDRNRSRILVLAFSFHDVNVLKLKAKKAGVPENRIEFVEFKSNFNYGSLRYTSNYSDVIVGPVPHKGVNIGDASSFLAAAENNPGEYPKIHRMTDSSGDLKVSVTGFMNCLEKTNFLKECRSC